MVGRCAALLVLGSATACNAVFGIDDLSVGPAAGGATSNNSTAITTSAPSSSSGTGGSSASSGGNGGVGGVQSCAYTASVLADQPVGYFRLNEMTGSKATDEMSVQAGDYEGGVVLGKPGPVNCQGDVAVSFDAMTSAVHLGERYEFAQGAEFTVEAWVNLTVIDSLFRAIVSKEFENLNGDRQGYFLWVTSGAGLGFEFVTDSNSDVAQMFIVPSGQWLHVVGSYDGTEACLYVNADLEACETMETALKPNSGAFRIGDFSLAQGHLGGTIDEVAIYDKVLPPARITAHYQAANSP